MSRRGVRIVKAGTKGNPPSDHDIVWAELQVEGVTFTVAVSNIRATPPMRARNVERCAHRVVSIPDVSIAGFDEMNRRNLHRLLPAHWRAAQGPVGDRRRAPIGFDDDEWELVRWVTPQLSSRAVTTRLGRILVPSGNRYATVAILRHRKTGIIVAAICYHAVAHMNRGARFGWTHRGGLRRLVGRIPNPFVTVYKDGMRNLQPLILQLRTECDGVVVMGDWNFDAYADLAALEAGHAERWAPAATMRRAGVVTVYSAHKLHGGTVAGGRGIDYIGVAPHLDQPRKK